MAECIRCGHIWNQNINSPKQCPKCQSKFWNKKYSEKIDREFDEWIKKNKPSPINNSIEVTTTKKIKLDD
jgi:predicted  nucleic acid-binding Zn-ribbon protein